MSSDVPKLLFGVRTLIRCKQPDQEDGSFSFEERVVIIEATDFEQALALGEAEGRKYASQFPDSWSASFIDDVQAFEIHSGPIKPGDEVWSVIRNLKMTDNEFSDFLARGDSVNSIKTQLKDSKDTQENTSAP